MRLPRFSKDPDTPRRVLFTDEDKANIRWFVSSYLKDKTPWLGPIASRSATRNVRFFITPTIKLR